MEELEEEFMIKPKRFGARLNSIFRIYSIIFNIYS